MQKVVGGGNDMIGMVEVQLGISSPASSAIVGVIHQKVDIIDKTVDSEPNLNHTTPTTIGPVKHSCRSPTKQIEVNFHRIYMIFLSFCCFNFSFMIF